MNNYAAIAFAVALTVWAVAAWDLGKKWLMQRPAALLISRLEKCEARTDVTARAVENLAKEFAEEVHTLKAQQVGVLSGMSAANRQRSHQR